MSANVAHRRGSVVDDTCYRCGQRVYLLERHLASTGQLFHRHCYRDSERTATLQRASSRRPSYQKENLLPPPQPEVASSRRTGRRKSSTSTANNTEPGATSAERCAVQGIRQHPGNVKPTEVEIPKMAGVVMCSGVAQKKVPPPTTVILLPESTDSGTCKDQRAQGTKHLSNPEVISAGSVCHPARLTHEDGNTKIAEPTSHERVNKTLTAGSTSVMDQRVTTDAEHAARSLAATVVQPPDRRRRETSVLSLMDRARPALSTTRPPGTTTSKTTSPEAAPVSKTGYISTSLSSSSASSIDRSCDVVPVTEPVRLVFRHAAPGFSAARENIAATTNSSDVRKKPNDRSASTTTNDSRLVSPSCSVNDRMSTSTVFENSSDRDIPVSPPSCDSVFATPTSSDFLKSGVSCTPQKTAKHPRRSEPPQPRSINDETTKSEWRRSSVEKQNGLSTKTRPLYRPKSLENLLEPSHGWKAHRTYQMLHDNDYEVPPANKEDTTSGFVSRPSWSHSGDDGPERLKDRRIDRPKSTFDLFSTTPQSRIYDERNSHEARKDAAKVRSEPIVKGLLENLTKARQRKMQESNLISDKEMAPRMPDVVASANSHLATTLRSEQFQQQAVEKHDSTSPVSSYPMSSHASSTARPKARSEKTSEENDDVALALPCDQVREPTPNVDGEPAELNDKKKYLTKWQAEIERRRANRVGQLTSRCLVHEPPPSPDWSAQNIFSPVETTPRSSAATNHPLSNKFSKSVNDLTQLAAATGKVAGRCGEQMTDWQLEVERRRAARGGRYVDPEKLPRSQRHEAPTRIKAETPPENTRKLMFELTDDSSFGSTQYDGAICGNQRVPAMYRNKKTSKLSVSVDNLATCHLTLDTSRFNRQPRLTSPELGKVSVDASLNAASSDVLPSSRRSVGITRSPTSSPDHYYESIDDFQESPVAESDNTCQVGDFLVINDSRRIHRFAANRRPVLCSSLLTDLL